MHVSCPACSLEVSCIAATQKLLQTNHSQVLHECNSQLFHDVRSWLTVSENFESFNLIPFLQYRHSELDEIRILLVHGVLHLLGFDHETGPADAAAMAQAEASVMKHLRWQA